LWDPDSPYYVAEAFQHLLNRGPDATKFGIEKGSWE